MILALTFLPGVSGITREAAFAARISGEPLDSDQASPALIEFGEPTVLPSPEAVRHNPALLTAALRRQLVLLSEGREPEMLPELRELVLMFAPGLPEQTGILALEVLGRLGVAVPDPGGLASSPTALLRYASETGATMEPPAGLTPLARVYAARIHPGLFLDDPCWAVRFAAVERADSASASALVDDPVPAVALKAAEVSGDREAIQRLSLVPGPVGNMATGLIDHIPTLEEILLTWPDPGRRGAALIALAGLEWKPDPGQLSVLRHDTYPLIGAVIMEMLKLEPAEEAGDSVFSGGTGVAVPRMVDIATTEGTFTMELLPELAPLACESFMHLALNGFYDGMRFHRVIPGFVAQAGCPEGNGYGGPGYVLPAERSLHPYVRGTVGMADAGLSTGGSQFFITLDNHGRLEGRYTVFGVIAHTDNLDNISPGTEILGIKAVP